MKRILIQINYEALPGQHTLNPKKSVGIDVAYDSYMFEKLLKNPGVCRDLVSELKKILMMIEESKGEGA